MDNVFYTEQPQLVNRDQDGKFTSRFGSTWWANERRRQKHQAGKPERLQAEMGGWLAEHGIGADVAATIFA